MQNQSRECSSFSHTPVLMAPVLTAPLLSRIEQLNLEYLQLLFELPLSGPCAHADAWPAVLLSRLRELPPTALRAAAAAPYTLYSLGFDDQEFWLANLAAATVPNSQVADEPSGCRLPRHAAFCEAAIFFAWHLSVTNPLAAQLMCCMPVTLSECLQRASFGQLQLVMRSSPWLLMPRWPGNSRFWPELLQHAEAGDVQKLRHVHLLGNQLLACDLRLALSASSERAGRVRAARSAQQQRWKLHARS